MELLGPFPVNFIRHHSIILQGFTGVFMLVGYFLDSFLLEVNCICWKLDSMVRFLDRLLGNFCWICPTGML